MQLTEPQQDYFSSMLQEEEEEQQERQYAAKKPASSSSTFSTPHAGGAVLKVLEPCDAEWVPAAATDSSFLGALEDEEGLPLSNDASPLHRCASQQQVVLKAVITVVLRDPAAATARRAAVGQPAGVNCMHTPPACHAGTHRPVADVFSCTHVLLLLPLLPSRFPLFLPCTRSFTSNTSTCQLWSQRSIGAVARKDLAKFAAMQVSFLNLGFPVWLFRV